MNYATYLNPNSPAWFDRHAAYVIELDNARHDAVARAGELPNRPWSELRAQLEVVK